MKAAIVIFAFVLVGCQVEEFGLPDCPEYVGLIAHNQACMPADVQKFQSPGGDVIAGLIMQSLTRTAIADGECNSMCAIILITAEKRIVCENTWIGFHLANAEEGSELIRKRVREYVDVTNAFDYEFFSIMFDSAPNEDMNFASPHWLLSVGMIDEVLDCGHEVAIL